VPREKADLSPLNNATLTNYQYREGLRMNYLHLLRVYVTAALLCLVTSANAQITSFDVLPQPLGQATGTYHVVLTHISGSLFGVSIFGNPDGNFTEPAGPTEQKHSARVITMGFKDFLFNQVSVTSGSGSTSGPATETAPVNLALSFVPAAWSVDTSAGSFAAASPSGVINRLSAFGPALGGNTFDGFLTVSGAKYASIVVQDTDQQWFANDVLLTPEGSSLALLLPGLLPIGLVMRRRRQNK
jgi:hypothetical protein